MDGAVIDDFLGLLDEQSAVRVATSVGDFVRSRLARDVVVSTAVESVCAALQPCWCFLTDRKALFRRREPIDSAPPTPTFLPFTAQARILLEPCLGAGPDGLWDA